MLDIKDCDKSSLMTANDSKVAELAQLCIRFIKENPGIDRDQIIKQIDHIYDPSGQITQMRRTYDVLNILHMAEIVLVSDGKRYEYDPLVLEGAQAAEVHNWEAQIQ